MLCRVPGNPREVSRGRKSFVSILPLQSSHLLFLLSSKSSYVEKEVAKPQGQEINAPKIPVKIDTHFSGNK